MLTFLKHIFVKKEVKHEAPNLELEGMMRIIASVARSNETPPHLLALLIVEQSENDAYIKQVIHHCNEILLASQKASS